MTNEIWNIYVLHEFKLFHSYNAMKNEELTIIENGAPKITANSGVCQKILMHF